MAIYGAAENQYLGGGPGYGGGFGGWGGGFGAGGFGAGLVGGILGGALFGGRGGLFGRDGHHEGNCGCKCNADCHDVLELMEKLGDVDKDIFASANGTQKDICSLKDSFAVTNAAIANVNYNQAINTKDIIHDIDLQSCSLQKSIDKCCCETNHNIDKSTMFTNNNIDKSICALSKQISDCCCDTQKLIEAKFNALEVSELKERLHRTEKDNDLFRLNGIVSANIASLRATTVGSNFNTGTQTQSTSSNSGQQITPTVG